MPKLIKDNAIIENPWVIIDKEQGIDSSLENDSNYLLVPLNLWLENKTQLSDSTKNIGVWLDSDETPEMIKEDVSKLTLIALNFPTFMDGRGYSSAAVLRQQLQYSGELRAIGNILKDQLSYLKRCGFDSFDVSDEVKNEDALNGFSDFRDNYQTNVDKPEPIFRRR